VGHEIRMGEVRYAYILGGEPEEKSDLRYKGVGGRIIVKYILKRHMVQRC
jgi:hypothetical protein